MENLWREECSIYKPKPRKVRRKRNPKIKVREASDTKKEIVSFAELKSMEVLLDDERQKKRGNLEEKDKEDLTSIMEENDLLRVENSLDEDLLSNDKANRLTTREEEQQIEPFQFPKPILNEQNHFDSREKSNFFVNSPKNAPIRFKRISKDKKSKSLVRTKQYRKEQFIQKNNSQHNKLNKKQGVYKNRNSILVRNIRRRKERHSLIHNRSSSKKKPSKYTGWKYKSKLNERSNSPLNKKQFDLYKSQQNHFLPEFEAKYLSNSRTSNPSKSGFAKNNLSKNSKNVFFNDSNLHQNSEEQIESKRYMAFDPNNQDLFDSNVMNKGHLSASQNTQKISVNSVSMNGASREDLIEASERNEKGRIVFLTKRNGRRKLRR